MKIPTDILYEQDLKALIEQSDNLSIHGGVLDLTEEAQETLKVIMEKSADDDVDKAVLIRSLTYILKLYRSIEEIEDTNLKTVGRASLLAAVIGLHALDPTRARRMIALFNF